MIVDSKTKLALDYKGNDGLWRKSRTIEGKQVSTRAGRLWGGMNQRWRADIEFKDFQFFCEWCQLQFGYLSLDEDGNLWQIDKDIFSKGNAKYAPDTSVFIPSYVNQIFKTSSNREGSFLIGAYWREERGKFSASMTVRGNSTYFGEFETEMEAHRCWQKEKVNQLNLLLEDPLIANHLKVLNKITEVGDKINNDYLQGVPTLSVLDGV